MICMLKGQLLQGRRTDTHGEGEEAKAGEDVLYKVWLARADEGGGLPVVFCVIGGSRETCRK